MTGLFRNSGYFMGDRLYRPRDTNPLGFFEDHEVNSINESLLAPLLPQRFSSDGIEYAGDVPGHGQRWLSRVSLRSDIVVSDSERNRIKALISRPPFCFKDPRFCYTLPVWSQESTNECYLCVFREPSVVAASILKEVHTMPYLADLSISVKQILEVWRLMYRHVLEVHANNGEWLFLFYEDLFRCEVLERIESCTGASIDRSFPRRELNRTKPLFEVDKETLEIFSELLCRAKP